MNSKDLLNNFFEENQENEGWIITKNEKGKIKVATCEGDETNIYEKTRDWLETPAEETRLDTLKKTTPELYKTAQFFIRDLLDAEIVDNYFISKSVKFFNVLLSGTVVSLFSKDNNYWIGVDDGTSSIKCIILKQNLDHLQKSNDSTIELGAVNVNSSNLLQTAALTLKSKNYMEKIIPSFDNLQLGDIVKVIGRLSEYKNYRNIFISKIVKISQETYYFDIENLIYLYTEIYD